MPALLCGIMSAQVNVYTRNFNNARTGANLQESTLSPANVNSSQFGKLFTVNVDGEVYAQPLYVSNLPIVGGTHNVVYVATMNNTVYALDADTGARLWTRNLGTPINTGEVEVGSVLARISPIGILSTPVIDPATRIMYLVHGQDSTVNGSTSHHYVLEALDIINGDRVLGSPKQITASYKDADRNTPLVLNPQIQTQRSSLALANGNVYFGLGANGDHGPWHGWLLSYNASNLDQNGVFVNTPIGYGGGIWMAGAAPAIDQNGDLYMSTGNGDFGITPNKLVQTGESLIKLSPSLQLLDYFTPKNEAALTAGDQDLASGGVLLVPDANNPGRTQYVLTGGKQGILYLTNPNDLGKFHASEDQVTQEFQAIFGYGTSHIHGTPVYFDSAAHGPSTYVWGENDFLRGYRFNAAGGLLDATPFAKSTMTAPTTHISGAMPGGFLSISADGGTNGIIWASTPYVASAFTSVVQGVLYAFNADTLQLLWSDKFNDSRDEVGLFAKFVPPVVANGKLYVATFGPLSTGRQVASGQLVVYGLLKSPVKPTLTVRVNNASMVEGSALPAFTSSVTGLVNGDTVGKTIEINYSTTAGANSAPGTYPITATVTGSSASKYQVDINSGTLTVIPPSVGTVPNYPTGFQGTEMALNGEAVFTGGKLRLTNGGLKEASSAFFRDLVNVQAFSTQFEFLLTDPSANGFTFAIQGVGSTALGVDGGSLGYQTIGKSVAVKFDLFNSAGEGTDSTGMYINGAAPTVPAINLSTTGINLHSGDVFRAQLSYNGTTLTVVITDTVTRASATQTYTVNIPAIVGGANAYVGFTGATGGLSAIQDILNWTYTPQAGSQAFSSYSSTLNGGATVSGTSLLLTDGLAGESRSAFFNAPLNVQQFTASFDFQITDPNADGMTFTIQGNGRTALGTGGSGLGYTGIGKSVAIKFDLHNNAGEGQDSTGLYTDGATPTVPATNLPTNEVNLHSGDPFHVQLAYNGITLTVTITDSVTKTSATQAYTVNIPAIVGGATAYFGFTGGTGGNSAVQRILDWSYSAG
ncbi:lectin-like domain-containing protein [Acidisarcina polymorpha]|uniref:MBG domain-containing protein n=1 Tax=Acidisarcina polymorpha TaxID=2211140 RepID=UPI001374F606|nr:MBG domain-containing protein [Acidisarcina polymorpha]